MSHFMEFKKSVKDRLDFLVKNSVTLFQVDVDKDELWNMYLDAFPEGTNPIFRERRHYDCSCCRSFVKQYGTIVGVINGRIESIWDDSINDFAFQAVAHKLNKFITDQPIANVFCTKFPNLGTDYSHELMANDVLQRWEHFYYRIPSQFVVSGRDSVESKQGAIRQTKEVIARSFQELTPSAIDTVLELIEEKTLYRGEEHKQVLEAFKGFQKGWIVSNNKDNYCWEIAVKEGRFAAIRNTAIGTLLINLSEGMDIELAVKKYEQVVAPANYKRPKAIYTKAMIQQAQEKIESLGLTNSLARRYAKLEDISINNVIWASGDSKKVMKSVFDLLEEDLVINPKSFTYADEMYIEDFITNILPTVSKLELFIDNSYRNNLVSLIAPVDLQAPSLFKWNNGFSWNYAGNFTDSIKESVKKHGGKVDGALRFSLSWAEGDSSDNSDLDAHCVFPGGHIYYGQKTIGSGKLDVDIIHPNEYSNKDIVENITWPTKQSMPKGRYNFYVNNYNLRGNQKGFKAELEFDGVIHSFEYTKAVRNNENVQVVVIDFDGTNIKIIESLPSNISSKKIWNINTMQLVPVTTVMFSPNYWDEQQGIGNKHYFFMLENCFNDDNARGFYNEFLRSDLIQHKRVFEALGAKMKVEHTDNQLSGVGFSSTMDNTLNVKINNSKIIKINFNNGKFVSSSTKKKISV